MATYVEHRNFGPGAVWVKGLTDITGATITTGIPRRINQVQEFSLDIERSSKPAHGENWIQLAAAGGPGKISGKCKFLGLSAAPLNEHFFGLSGQPTTGQSLVAVDQSNAIPATPFTVTIAPPNSGTFAADLGVRNKADGTVFVRVASAPTAGQYSVNEGTGVYTFASADNVSGITVVIDYRYTVAASGAGISVTQQPIGAAPSYELTFRGLYLAKQIVIVASNVVSDKLAWASKLDNWSMPEFDFTVFEPTGIVGNSALSISIGQA